MCPHILVLTLDIGLELMSNANFHRILADSPAKNDYLSQLTISPEQTRTLRNARDLARKAIYDGIRNWKEALDPSELLTKSALSADLKIKLPKFKMQGSFAYKTLNLGAHIPPQEIDLDDGMFLPVTYEEFTGNPSVLSQDMFRIVEHALKPLCEKRGWQLVVDKATCVRIILNHGTHAHIDIALYAIEENQYFQLHEELIHNTDRAMKTDDALLFENLYKSLPSDFIMLAHREIGWMPSDPRKLEDWFVKAVKQHGHQLTRLCRYLKGWRDQTWENCSLSSIALMKVVTDIFQNQSHEFDKKRDDLALKNVVRDLPALLTKGIENPAISDMYLDEGWSDADRDEFYTEAILLKDKINSVLNASSEITAISQLRETFGTKIPNDPSLIQLDEGTTNSIGTTAGGALILESSSSYAQTKNPENAVKKGGGGRYA